MFKTRAYLCQTVTEASPMSRLASTLVGQARQALEGLFRRAEVPKVPWGTVTRTEAPTLAVGRRGLVTGIDRGGSSLVRQFLARNRPADLAAAMRKRYSVRVEFKGVGKGLATFGFAGVGVAAGSQWGGSSEVDGDFNFVPFFETVKTMFGSEKAKVDRSLAMLSDFQRGLEDFSRCESASVIEPELSFVLLDDSTISSEKPSLDNADEVSMLNDAVVELTTQKSDDEYTVQLSSSIEDVQAQLGAELVSMLTTVDTQRTELRELSVVVSQLNVLLSELTGTSPVTPIDELFMDFVVIEENIEDDDDNTMGGGEERQFIRALSLVAYQKQQLDIIHRTVRAQNEQLLSLVSESPGGTTVIPRSTFCKRDACCGPGFVG